MSIDYKNYHPEWKTKIRPAILRRAGDRCERCKVKNYETGARDLAGKFWTERQIACMPVITAFSLFGIARAIKPKIIKIVLTIAHLDHDIENNDPGNLAALCQKCHLGHDRQQHARTRRDTRNRRTGQQELF